MMTSGKSILIVNEDSREIKTLVKVLNAHHFRVNSASNGYTGLEYMSFEHYDILFVSSRIPLLKFEDLLPRIRKLQPYSKLILLGDVENYSGLIQKYHIFDCLKKPCEVADLEKLIEKLTNSIEVSKYKIIGSGLKMKTYFSLLEKIMRSSVTVLVHGESGTGKELTARALHEGGPRAGKPFVTVNCATIPENLLESELFGHEKGSFTGALQKRVGKFELANKGTIFLDEIGELSPIIQAKFLRVLEDQAFERVGGNETIHVDVRIISATNKNLKDMVDQKLFREDLYYRLNAIPIFVPPLREKKEDIPELVSYFMEKYLPKTGKTTPMNMSPDALDMLIQYWWPGNIRELENVIMRSMVLCEDLEITCKDLPEEVRVRIFPTVQEIKEPLIQRVCSLRELEREAIEKALIESNYNATKAARLLKIGRMTFYRKAKLYSIRLNE